MTMAAAAERWPPPSMAASCPARLAGSRCAACCSQPLPAPTKWRLLCPRGWGTATGGGLGRGRGTSSRAHAKRPFGWACRGGAPNEHDMMATGMDYCCEGMRRHAEPDCDLHAGSLDECPDCLVSYVAKFQE